MEPSWDVLEAMLGHLGRLGGHLGRLGGHLGRLGAERSDGGAFLHSFAWLSGWPAGSAEAA